MCQKQVNCLAVEITVCMLPQKNGGNFFPEIWTGIVLHKFGQPKILCFLTSASFEASPNFRSNFWFFSLFQAAFAWELCYPPHQTRRWQRRGLQIWHSWRSRRFPWLSARLANRHRAEHEKCYRCYCRDGTMDSFLSDLEMNGDPMLRE